MFDSRLNVGCFIMVFVQVKYGFRTEVIFVSTPNSFDVSWYKCLIVSLVFSHLGFWSGNLFLIAPFPELCLLVPFDYSDMVCFKIVCNFVHRIFINNLLK